MTYPLYVFGSKDVPAEHYRKEPERLLAGNPQLTVWQHYTDATGEFAAGEWAGDVGTWRVEYTEEEFCQIIEGVSVITGDDGNAVTVRAGDRFVVPAGFRGTWQVIERTRKTYVVFERKR